MFFSIVIVCSVTGPLPVFASYYTFVIVSLTRLADFMSHDYLSYISSLVITRKYNT